MGGWRTRRRRLRRSATCSSGKISPIIDASRAFVAGVNFEGLSMTRLPAAIAVTTGISDRLTG